MFKSNMGVNLSLKKTQYIWGKGVIKELDSSLLKNLDRGTKSSNSLITANKLNIAKQNLKFLFLYNWVRFVGISGSVSAGFAKEDDDIDLVIVVRDGCAWIYRGILTLRNIKSHFMRTKRDGENVKDLFCINFVIEEKGLTLDSDIFNFHELMYLIPLHNDRYLPYIYKRNPWLSTDYGANKEFFNGRNEREKPVNFLIQVVNYLAYVAQIFFMAISGHKPEIKRILGNYKKGRIEFFPKDFKKNILGGLKTV